MRSKRHHLFKEGSWYLAGKLESFTRCSWMLSSFGEKTFHHIHCAFTKNANCFIMLYVPCSLASSSHTSTYCIMCVHTQLLNPTHAIYFLFSLIWELENSVFLGSKAWQKYKNIQETFHVAIRLLSVLFCPTTAAACLVKTFWDSKLTAWIRLWHTVRQIYTIVRPRSRRRVRARTRRRLQSSATLRDFSLPGLRRVFAGYWKFQVVLHAGSQCHSGP